MTWNSHYIVYRVGENGELIPVYRADDIKSAKYWLSYIAQVGDILCRTPLHPKHSGTSDSAEYWSHKAASGKSVSSFELWQKQFCNFPISFPSQDSL